MLLYTPPTQPYHTQPPALFYCEYHDLIITGYIFLLFVRSVQRFSKMPLSEKGSRSTTPPAHISIDATAAEGHDSDDPRSGVTTPKSSSGWDGKLRVEKKQLELANPEALSDPDYSDEENVAPGEVIEADEGTSLLSMTKHARGT